MSPNSSGTQDVPFIMTPSLRALLLSIVGAASLASAAIAGVAQPPIDKRGFPGQQKKWGVSWSKSNNPLQINNFLGYNGWWYNWESNSNGISPSNGMPFVPMMHTLGGNWNQWFTNDVINNQGNFPYVHRRSIFDFFVGPSPFA